MYFVLATQQYQSFAAAMAKEATRLPGDTTLAPATSAYFVVLLFNQQDDVVDTKVIRASELTPAMSMATKIARAVGAVGYQLWQDGERLYSTYPQNTAEDLALLAMRCGDWQSS